MTEQKKFMGTIGWVKGNLMVSSVTKDDITDSWAPGNVYTKGELIPVMTSNTTPQGRCHMFSIPADSNAYQVYNLAHTNTAARTYPTDEYAATAYKAFRNKDEATGTDGATFGSKQTRCYVFVQYDFGRNILVDNVTFKLRYNTIQNKNVIDYQLSDGTWVNAYSQRSTSCNVKINDRIKAGIDLAADDRAVSYVDDAVSHGAERVVVCDDNGGCAVLSAGALQKRENGFARFVIQSTGWFIAK